MINFEDFKKPINIIFLLFAIIGLASSFYFYSVGKKIKSISYQTDEPSYLIYDNKNSTSAIRVVDKDSLIIKNNVYLLTGVVWNSGNLPISNDDVRLSINLNLPNALKIIDFKIVKQIDPEVANFKLTKLSNKSLSLSWKYFDPGYSFRFQIIYTGYENSQFNLSGKILDLSNFKNEVAVKKDPSQREIYVFSLILVIILAFAYIPLIKRIYLKYKIIPDQFKRPLITTTAAFVVSIILIIYLVIRIYLSFFSLQAPL